jgi:hypothetical protein
MTYTQNSKLSQKGPFFTALYSADTLIVGAPSTVKHKMMSAGLVILAVQHLLWSFPSVYDVLDCFLHFAFCDAYHAFLVPRQSVTPRINIDVREVLYRLCCYIYSNLRYRTITISCSSTRQNNTRDVITECGPSIKFTGHIY